MNIAVKGIVTKEHRAIENYAQKKAQKFYHYNPEITKVEIELRNEPGRKNRTQSFIADITLHIPGKTLKISDPEDDLYKAIDRAVDRMVEVLRREKGKKQDRLERQVNRLVKKGLGYLPEVWRLVDKGIFRRKS